MGLGKLMSGVCLVLLCMLGRAHADPPRGATQTLWKITSPSANTMFAQTSPIACAGSAAVANASFVLYAYHGEVVVSSINGTTTSNKDWSATLPVPQGGWSGGATITIKLYYQGDKKDEVDVRIEAD